MGIKSYLENMKKKRDEKAAEKSDPAAQKKRQREEMKKNFDRSQKAITLVTKGVKKYKEASEKIEKAKDALTEKTIEAAGKIENAAESLTDKAKKFFHRDEKPKAPKKPAPKSEPKFKGPSTGSGLIDFLAPAVPKDAEKKQPKKSPGRKPKN